MPRNNLNKHFNDNADPSPSYDERQQFVNAAGTGDVKVVSAFLQQHPEHIDTYNAYHYVPETALMRAAATGRKEVVELLLQKGADVDKVNPNGWTALSQAAKEGKTDIVGLLLDKGADINGKDSQGWTPLMSAVWSGETETVKLLLNRGASLTRTALGKTAIDYARDALKEFTNVETSRPDLLKARLEAGKQIEKILVEEQARRKQSKPGGPKV